MEFFDKLGKKASEAYKVTADKTGKIAKETKLKFKISELKTKIEEIYEEIGKKVYEKHVAHEEISSEELAELCKKIDDISSQIEVLLKKCLELRDKKQCPKCFKEIDQNMKYCPECGEKQPESEDGSNKQNEEQDKKSDTKAECNKQNEEQENENNVKSEEESSKDIKEEKDNQTNLEKTTEIEINPDAEGITDEEMKNIGI